jgi:hypothetical protein
MEDGDRDGDCGRGGMIMPGTHRLFQSLLISGNSRAAPGGSSNNINNNNNYYYVEGIRNLQQIYPYRDIQIGQLSAILSGTISLTSSINTNTRNANNLNTNQVYVPAPIFCTGPKGTGKTSIVCDVIETLLLVQQQQQQQKQQQQQQQQQQQNCVQEDDVVQIQPAYINCSIVEPSTIERLVYTIYQQLRPSSMSKSKSKSKTKTTASPNKKSGMKKKKKKKLQSGLNQQQQKQSDNGQQQQQQPKILPSRKAKRAATRKTYANNATTNFNNEIKKRRRKMKKEYEGGDDDDDHVVGVGENNVETSHKAVMSLGRSLQRYYGEGSSQQRSSSNNNVGILVLDKGEELLSLSSIGKKKSAPSTSAAATNFLSELLLLPKIMKLNITVIVITNYSTLDMTRKFLLGLGLGLFLFLFHPLSTCYYCGRHKLLFYGLQLTRFSFFLSFFLASSRA